MQMKNPFSSDGGDAGSPEPGASMWSPLRGPVFRAVWIAWVVSNTGTWMQNVGAAWLMTTLTPSPLLVALMQTATSLPVFLVGLPAGALADVVDRRKLLLVTQTWMRIPLLAMTISTIRSTRRGDCSPLLAAAFPQPAIRSLSRTTLLFGTLSPALHHAAHPLES